MKPNITTETEQNYGTNSPNVELLSVMQDIELIFPTQNTL